MNKILSFLEKTALTAGELIRDAHKKGATGIALKARNDYVTDTDRSVESLVKEKLSLEFPSVPLLTEEGSGSSTGKEESFFCLDPLDGTNNFVHSIPIFCVSLALVENMTPTLGVVYDPIHNELFSAEKGRGATLNGEKIKTSDKLEVVDSFLATGFAFRERGRVKEYLEGFERVLNATGGIRRCGAAAVDLCWTACGRFDAFWEFGLKPWDVAAGKVIVEESGGAVCDTNGGKLDLFKGDLLAASTDKLKSSLLALINKE